jgi:hypothetical protein
MDVTPATSASTTSAAANAQKSLSGNFETFLTLLTTQLKNQDPLSPMDSNQFTQQLVQFSQVEQQINSNKNLESLIALTKSQSATSAVSYLGKTLTDHRWYCGVAERERELDLFAAQRRRNHETGCHRFAGPRHLRHDRRNDVGPA